MAGRRGGGASGGGGRSQLCAAGWGAQGVAPDHVDTASSSCHVLTRPCVCRLRGSGGRGGGGAGYLKVSGSY